MFKILPQPTFEAIVEVPVPGSDAAPLCLVFKHKNRKEVVDFFDMASKAEAIDATVLSEIIIGWKDVDAEFNVSNLQQVIDNYHAVVPAIFKTYGEQLAEGRRKN
jgi:hypothetical protein